MTEKKKLLVLCVALFCFIAVSAQQRMSVSSPDGKLRFSLKVTSESVSYDIDYRKQPLITNSLLGFSFDSGEFGGAGLRGVVPAARPIRADAPDGRDRHRLGGHPRHALRHPVARGRTAPHGRIHGYLQFHDHRPPDRHRTDRLRRRGSGFRPDLLPQDRRADPRDPRRHRRVRVQVRHRPSPAPAPQGGRGAVRKEPDRFLCHAVLIHFTGPVVSVHYRKISEYL